MRRWDYEDIDDWGDGATAAEDEPGAAAAARASLGQPRAGPACTAPAWVQWTKAVAGSGRHAHLLRLPALQAPMERGAARSLETFHTSLRYHLLLSLPADVHWRAWLQALAPMLTWPYPGVAAFRQVELSARSEEALDALQGRVRSKIPALARSAGPASGPLRAEACMASFDAPAAQAEGGAAAEVEAGEEGSPAGAEGAADGDAAAAAEEGDGMPAEAGSQHRCLFFVGVAEKEVRGSSGMGLVAAQCQQRGPACHPRMHIMCSAQCAARRPLPLPTASP